MYAYSMCELCMPHTRRDPEYVYWLQGVNVNVYTRKGGTFSVMLTQKEAKGKAQTHSGTSPSYSPADLLTLCQTLFIDAQACGYAQCGIWTFLWISGPGEGKTGVAASRSISHKKPTPHVGLAWADMWGLKCRIHCSLNTRTHSGLTDGFSS